MAIFYSNSIGFFYLVFAGKSTVCGESDVKIHGPDTHFQPLPDPTEDFCCTLCPKKFNRQDLLRKHNKSHVNSVCTLCRQVFNDKHALTKHQIEVRCYLYSILFYLILFYLCPSPIPRILCSLIFDLTWDLLNFRSFFCQTSKEYKIFSLGVAENLAFRGYFV